MGTKRKELGWIKTRKSLLLVKQLTEQNSVTWTGGI